MLRFQQQDVFFLLRIALPVNTITLIPNPYNIQKKHNTQMLADHDPHFKIFHELMAFRVREILLVSTPYDAYILEEDGALASQIINEYQGLNLSHPPRLTRAGSADQAMDLLTERRFDLVVTMANLGRIAGCEFARRVRQQHPDIPVILLAHSAREAADQAGFFSQPCFDNTYTWCADSSILLAII